MTRHLTKIFFLGLSLAGSGLATFSSAQDAGRDLTLVSKIVADGKGGLVYLPVSAATSGGKCISMSYKLCGILFRNLNRTPLNAQVATTMMEAYCHQFSASLISRAISVCTVPPDNSSALLVELTLRSPRVAHASILCAHRMVAFQYNNVNSNTGMPWGEL